MGLSGAPVAVGKLMRLGRAADPHIASKGGYDDDMSFRTTFVPKWR